jgi:MEDS: MEthanogen/methylotroph, DcmR Sensory domain/Histidine kinase-like ATPase domain
MSTANGACAGGFRHEALLYAGTDDFVAQAIPIVTRALEAGEPVLVALDTMKMGRLRDRLGGSASRAVGWTDIRGIGGNPARIIPLWHHVVGRHRGGGRLWGFGEPVWAGRSPAELVEAQRHEELLNLAFAEAPGFTLLCPYDTEGLAPDVLREAHRSHPFMAGGGSPSDVACLGPDTMAAPFRALLPEPGSEPSELEVDGAPGPGVRRLLAEHAAAAGVDAARTDDLTIAIAAVTHGLRRPDRPSRLRLWEEPGAVVAEIGDLAGVDDPLAGREWPPPSQGPSRGLWLANQLCDLVQLRAVDGGAVVRLRVAS